MLLNADPIDTICQVAGRDGNLEQIRGCLRGRHRRIGVGAVGNVATRHTLGIDDRTVDAQDCAIVCTHLDGERGGGRDGTQVDVARE